MGLVAYTLTGMKPEGVTLVDDSRFTGFACQCRRVHGFGCGGSGEGFGQVGFRTFPTGSGIH